jgi:hypothetical protein
VAVVLFLWILFNSGSTIKRHSLIITKTAFLQKIGLGLRDYEQDHGGKLPQHLSDLVPTYLAATNIYLFFGPTIALKSESFPAETDLTNRQAIDEKTVYIYTGQKQTNGVIAYERRGVWKDTSSWTYQRLNVLFSDYSVETCSKERCNQLGIPSF